MWSLPSGRGFLGKDKGGKSLLRDLLLPSWEGEKEENVAMLAILFINAFLYNKMTN